GLLVVAIEPYWQIVPAATGVVPPTPMKPSADWPVASTGLHPPGFLGEAEGLDATCWPQSTMSAPFSTHPESAEPNIANTVMLPPNAKNLLVVFISFPPMV